MSIFIDTSAVLAILDADDSNHLKAKDEWNRIVLSESNLICSNYVLVETFALVQHRLGMKAVRTLREDILPVVNIEWVDETSHNSAVSALLAASRRRLSLVDCVSFEMMRKLGIRTAFTFDSHFGQQGYECIP